MSKTWAAFGTLPDPNGENSVQPTISRALTYLSVSNQKTFQKKFTQQAQDEHQAMHTFSELLTGVFLIRNGYTAQYEPEIDGLTPDWRFELDHREEFIADLVNFHVEKRIEGQIDQSLNEGITWSGEIPDQSQRLFSTLSEKAAKYKNLVAKNNLPYIVFLFGWMNAATQWQEVEKCLVGNEGLFQVYPTLSGLYHMYEKGDCRLGDSIAGYRFDYFENPKATFPVQSLKSGVLPYGFLANSQ